MNRSVFSLLTIVLIIFQAWSAAAEVSVTAAVDQQNVYVGESFTFQIQVEGNDSPAEPDMSGLEADFTVTPRGGQQNNSQSVTIINGKVNRVSRLGYTFNYSLTPKKAGRLIIPSLQIKVESRVYRTNSVAIIASKPQETEDFKLRVKLSKNTMYVGEPVEITVTWYIGKDVNDFNFTFPLISDPRFSLYDSSEKQAASNTANLLKIPLGSEEVIAVKGNGTLNGKNFLTVTFNKTLIAKEAGTFVLPEATVACKALAGYSRGSRQRDPFDSFFNDSFFNRSRQVYKTVVVPSNQPEIEVKELPKQGRPANFTGLVGSYSLAVNASPTEVKVGDPITLTIQVAGPYVREVVLPDLKEQLNTNDFKIPEEMAAGEVKEGMLKTFSQTIRARHTGVIQVPAIGLSFFNTQTGKYEEARSKPIDLEVSAARVVTSQDAEGQSAQEGFAKKELHVAKGGIRFNYDGQTVLEAAQPVNKPEQNWLLWIILIGLPPVLFLAIFISEQLKNLKNRDPQKRQARKAYSLFTNSLQDLRNQPAQVAPDYDKLAHSIRIYLGAKLNLNAAALTFADVEPLLASRRVPKDVLLQLKGVLEQCEAHYYAGGLGSNGNFSQLLDLVEEVISQVEKVFGK